MSRPPSSTPSPYNASLNKNFRIDYHCACIARLIELPDLEDENSMKIKKYAISHHISAIRQIKNKSIPICPKKLEQVAISTLIEHGHRVGESIQKL